MPFYILYHLIDFICSTQVIAYYKKEIAVMGYYYNLINDNVGRNRKILTIICMRIISNCTNWS